MAWSVLIAHAPKEEALAERLVEPVEQAGYTVSYRGSVGVGDSIELEATRALESGGPVVLCGTQRAAGSRWAWSLVNAARAAAGRQRVFVVQMEREAYVDPLARDGTIARYWEDPAQAIRELLAALNKHYPLATEATSRVQSGLIDFAQERVRHGEIIGREKAIAKVRGWIEDLPRGWVLIKGGPGTGKSALVVALLNQLEKEHGAGSVPYHFLRRGQGNWNEPDVVLRNLIARLERIGAPGERGAAQGTERLYALLVAVAARYAEDDRRLVLVVDGLDEAAAAGRAESILGRFLPTSLPDNVFVLCASRPNYPELGWLDQRSGLHTIDLDRPPWLEDNRALVEAYWRERGPQLEPPLDEELIAEAIGAADGNMLHAVTLFDAFETDTQARDPNRIPVGFAALLEGMWVRLVEMDDRDVSAHVIDGLCLLAVAGEALPLSTLARLLDWKHPADVVDFKRYALPFLLEENADWHGGEARYRPFHESMREFLSSGDRLLPGALDYHELLARKLAAWPPPEGAGQLERRYAARFALVHLAATADWPRITELLGDLRYGVAAVEALGPQVLLERIAPFTAAGRPEELVGRAAVLQRVLRQESQWLETHPRELPNVIHNRLTCLGWSRERIRSSFTGFDRGWGLVNPVAMGDEICILRGHTAKVGVCDLDSRGRYGVSGDWDGSVRVWDLERGTPLHVLRPDPSSSSSEVHACAISSDGRHVLIASGPGLLSGSKARSQIQLWDALDGRLLHEFDLLDDPFGVGLAFTGSDALVCYPSGHVDLYDMARGAGRRLTLGEEVADPDVDASGTLIAAVTNDGCGVWRLADGSKLSAVSFEDAQLCSLSPDGQAVAVAASGGAAIANTADGSISYRTEAIEELSDCCLLDDRRLLFASGWDVDLVVWDMKLDRALVRLEGHTYTADCCAATPDGRLALSGGGDSTARLWSLADKASVPRVDRHEKLVYGCVVDEAATLACSAPQEARPVIWDARTGVRLRTVETDDVSYGFVRFCRFDDRSRLATLGESLRLFDPGTARQVWCKDVPVRGRHGELGWVDESTIEGGYHGGDLGHPGLLPLLLAGSTAIVWQPTGELEPVELPGESSDVSRLNSGRSLAVVHERSLGIIDLDRGEGFRRIAENVRACVGSPRSQTVYALMLDGRLRRLDAASGAVQAELGELTQEGVRLLIDPEETALWALCSTAGKASRADADEVLVAFSPEATGMLQRASIPGHRVFGFSFLDGMLITAGWDATLRVWNAHEPMPAAAISGSSPFRCVAAARDRLVAGDQKGNVWFLAPMAQLYS